MAILSDITEASSSSSSSSTIDYKYDVFMSFRGRDTRLSFTDHLHRALLDANMNPFLEDEEIETGGYLKPELEGAIKASRASIIVLSKNYASSTWCLDELVSIMDQYRNSNHIVIPIYYHVYPTDVRRQQNSFGDAMMEHKRSMEAETNAEKKSQLAQKIDLWNKALTEVACITGRYVAQGRLETEFIGEIVTDIYNRLRLGVPLRKTSQDLIGVDHHVQCISSWLNDGSTHTADILTILGTSGIGKTSLADYIFRLHRYLFQRSSFIDDINRRCRDESNNLLDLQKQLCADISKTSWIHVDHVSIYTSAIENAVASTKVFLVLDDIDSLDQLDALLGNKGFHPGSKIIITTENQTLTEKCALFNPQVQPKHKKVTLEGLNETSSLQLLSFHAFKGFRPTEGHKKISKRLARICEEHPLALKVVGRSLCDRVVAEWEGYVERLEKESGAGIKKVLRMIFDSLSSQNEKELFKDIACFFVGKDRDYTETILKACGIRPKLGIANLIDRCLLTIGQKNELMMHQLLQEMGRDVVRQESLDKPWKRSRLWCHKESFQVLKQTKGKGKQKGIVLDMRMLEKEKLDGSLALETDLMSTMDHLMLLKLNYVQINGSYKNFPKNLRWLCMHQFPSEHMPSDLPMENLVALDMSYSKFKSFDMSNSDSQRLGKTLKLIGTSSKDKRLLGSLKILNLSFSKHLRCVGGFLELPLLERLILTNCVSLIEICESIQKCDELVLIDLSYCNKLEKLPISIGKLENLKTLSLDACDLHEFRVVKKYTESFASNVGINSETPVSNSIVEAIPSNVKFLISLPASLVRLSLAYNNLSNDSFPTDCSALSTLKYLNLDGNSFSSLPDFVRTLPRLQILSMNHCTMLRSIEHPPRTLRQLILDTYGWQHNYYNFLRKIVFDPEMSPLKLSVDPFLLAPSSFEIVGMVKIQPMADVEEKLLPSLGWSNLGFVKERRVGTYDSNRGLEGSQSQMYYEFGIFSTIYGGEEMPSWISDIRKGSSIFFTIPSSHKQLRGLNLCYVITCRDQYSYLKLSKIMIHNRTQNRTWIYNHYIDSVNVAEEYLIFLSHWMFGKNEMQDNDHIIVTATQQFDQPSLRECGISLVYDDGNNGEEDVLRYYKSWNHIIGGDLSPFQTPTGDYILDNHLFFQNYIKDIVSRYVSEPSIADKATNKDDQVWFKAFSPRNSNMLDG